MRNTSTSFGSAFVVTKDPNTTTVVFEDPQKRWKIAFAGCD
jgi:hypothetical protein